MKYECWKCDRRFETDSEDREAVEVCPECGGVSVPCCPECGDWLSAGYCETGTLNGDH